ncbi:unnamed protein product [Caenorhabditis auriculariae]|uniref:Uncharacterized protein n=1 Tax=Caenorhabditis auriculariae TaxID=2777116 RepID=A0A8S1GNX5_9PELO|nr:unnamed protein product [Caenorhabditis auriculariae]
MSQADRFAPSNNQKSSKVSTQKKSTLDGRPPWNSDTYIEGYDDVDEKGHIRRKYVAVENKTRSQAQQDELNQSWTHSLRAETHK